MNKNIKIIIIKKNNLEKLPNYLEKYNISKKNIFINYSFFIRYYMQNKHRKLL